MPNWTSLFSSPSDSPIYPFFYRDEDHGKVFFVAPTHVYPTIKTISLYADASQMPDLQITSPGNITNMTYSFGPDITNFGNLQVGKPDKPNPGEQQSGLVETGEARNEPVLSANDVRDIYLCVEYFV